MNNKSIKICSIVLIFALALTLSACGGNNSGESNSGEKEVYELYNEANKKLNEADSYSAKTDMSMSMEGGAQDMDMTNSGNMKQVKEGDDKVIMEVDLDTEVMGQKMKTKAYYTDGYYYTDTQGQKMKIKMSMDQVMQQANSGSFDVNEDAVKEQSSSSTDDGTEIKMTLDGQKMMDRSSSAFGGLGQLGSVAENIKMGDFDLTALIDKDGNLKTSVTDFSFSMTAENEEINTKAKMIMDVTKIGGVEVELPNDLDSYQEASGQLQQ